MNEGPGTLCVGLDFFRQTRDSPFGYALSESPAMIMLARACDGIQRRRLLPAVEADRNKKLYILKGLHLLGTCLCGVLRKVLSRPTFLP